MNPPSPRTMCSLCLALLAVALLGSAACRRTLSTEEKALRAELLEALREGSYEKAVELASRVVGSAPHDDEAWERLVRAQIGLRHFTAAKQTLEEWHAAIPKPSPKWVELSGDIAVEQQDPSLALDSWTKALAADPGNVLVLRKIAQLYRAQERWAEEDATLAKLLAIEDNATDRTSRALARRRLHRWSEALNDLRRAQELKPDAPEVRTATKLFERVSKFLAAIRDLDARLAITPGDDQLLADRALLFLRSEDPELALADSEVAAKLAEWAVRPRLFGALALIALGRAEECKELGIDSRFRLEALTPEFLETISRLDAEMSVERTNAELYVTRAWHLNDIGQPTLALRDAENAFRFDANSAGAHAESAYALAKLSRNDVAFEHIKRATELDANFSTAWHYRGELEMGRGDFVGAIESLSRALAINQTAAALQKRAECYVKVGELQKADEDQRALEALR